MPRLIINRKKPNKTPPCGRKITYVNPHSPFQKLVEAKRLESRGRFSRALSYEALAKAISSKEHPVNPATLWIWMHNENGFPSKRAFHTEHLEKLASVLKIPLPLLKETLDASKHLYTSRETAQPVQSLNAFDSFIETLSNDRRTNLKREYVLNLARSFRSSADSSRSEASAPK